MRGRSLGGWLSFGAMLVAAGVALPARVDQNLTGLQANWKDLETWSRPLDESREVELRLGLQPSGPGGTMSVAFLGRLSTRSPTTPPTQMQIQIGAGYLANPNVVRSPVLIFVADAGTDKRATIDLSARMVVDDPSPGGNIQNAVAALRAADFLRLAQAETLSGNIFGFDVMVRADQLKAMKAFAEKLYLVRTERRPR